MSTLLGFWRGRDHRDRVDEDRRRQQMEQRERPDQRAIGLDELPYETLRAVETGRQIEALRDEEPVVPQHAPYIERSERRHRGALIKLHRMARHAVAEIMRPGQ